MTHNRSSRITASRMLIGLMATVLLVMSLSAFTATPTRGNSPVHNAQAAVTIPHVSITTIGGNYNFSKSKITCQIVNNPEFTIKNKTTVTQMIIFNHGVFATLPPGSIDKIHISPTGTYVYSLQSNPAATLTIVVQ